MDDNTNNQKSVDSMSSSSAPNDDPLVGKWINRNVDFGGGLQVSLKAEFKNGGTGKCLIYKGDTLYQTEMIVWRKLWENKYILEIACGGEGVNYAMLEYNEKEGTLMDKNGRVWNNETKHFFYPGIVRVWKREE